MNSGWGRLILTFFILFAIVTPCFAQDDFVIKSLNIDSSGKTFLIQGKNAPGQNLQVTKQVLSSPLRVVYDIQNARLTSSKNRALFENSDISEIRIAQYSIEPSKVRVVFYCKTLASANRIKLNIHSNSIIFNYVPVPEYDNSFFIYKDSEPVIKPNVDYNAFYNKLNVILSDGKNPVQIKNPPTPSIEKIPDNDSSDGWKDIPISEDFPARYTILDVEKLNDKVIVKGKGIISFKTPFLLANPNRLVIDLTESKFAKKEITNDAIMKNNDKIRFGVFDSQTSRLVVESPLANQYHAIVSPNLEDLIIQKSNIINVQPAILYSVNTAAVNNYSSKMTLRFDRPVYFSLSKALDSIEINIYNLNKPDEQKLSNLNTTKQFRQISAQELPGTKTGYKLKIPIKSSSMATIEVKPDGKEININLKEKVQSGTTVVIRKGATILIDPGHGGSDCGAIRENINEKDLTLDLAQRLESYLKSYGIKVIKTRETDTTVSLQRRSEMSNELNPDAFVSIHINSFSRPEANGLETYWYQPQSKALAQIVHNYITLSIDSPDRGLNSARFYVINHTKAPSVLVEVGYISNPRERREMLTEVRKQKTVKAIGDGILLYLGMIYEQTYCK